MSENRIATFEKVSWQRYLLDWLRISDIKPDDEEFDEWVDYLHDEWEHLEMPERATTGSAGYDFKIPCTMGLTPGIPTTVPTGIRCKIEPGWMLALFPRSGLGFKGGVHLNNTVGIIDSDYYNAGNEGHIIAKLDAKSEITIAEGDRFIQGVFIPYGITTDDAASGERTGGFGSTGR